MSTRWKTAFLILFIPLMIASNAYSLPIVDQTGNLAVNGNFEGGTTDWTGGSYVPSAFTNWRQYNHTGVDTMPISTRLVSDPLIEGEYTAHLVGGWHDLIYQYDSRVADYYTVSGWVYTVSGSAFLGIAWNSGSVGAISDPTTAICEWEYVEFTQQVNTSRGGPTIGAAEYGSEFFIDGFWYNQGTTSTSPFAPIPEPSTLFLLGSGLIGLVALRKRHRP